MKTTSTLNGQDKRTKDLPPQEPLIQDVEPKNPPQSAAETQAPAYAQIRLVPYEDNARPVVANYTSIEIGTAMAYLDFGFLEPGLVNALRLAMQAGEAPPKQVQGRLATRVTLGFDVLHALQRQIQAAIDAMNRAAQQQLATYANSVQATAPAAGAADAARPH